MKIRFLWVFCLMPMILQELASKRAFAEVSTTKHNKRKRVKEGSSLFKKNTVELSNDIYDVGNIFHIIYILLFTG